MQVEDVNIDGKVQRKIQGQVGVDGTKHADSTADSEVLQSTTSHCNSTADSQVLQSTTNHGNSTADSQVLQSTTSHGNSTADSEVLLTADLLQNGKGSTEGQGLDMCLTVNANFPINFTTTPEISSMNQNNYISAESLQRFQQWKPGLDYMECWINDEGINAYNALLARRFQKMGREIYTFSSYFLPRWKRFEERGPENILHSLCQVSLLEKEAWIIPINHGAHWKVIIVNLITKSICLYDSMDPEREDPVEAMHFQAVRNFTEKVHNFFGKRWNSHDWKQCIAKETPKQCNAFDCGIFILKFVDYAISGRSLSFSQDDMPRFRMEMAREIIAMRLRSEDTEPLTELQLHQPISVPKVSVESKEHMLDAVGCKSQAPKKKYEAANFDNDEDCVSDSTSGAESEDFNSVASQFPPRLLSHLPTEASTEYQLRAPKRELRNISFVDPGNSFSEDDAALAGSIKTSNSKPNCSKEISEESSGDDEHCPADCKELPERKDEAVLPAERKPNKGEVSCQSQIQRKDDENHVSDRVSASEAESGETINAASPTFLTVQKRATAVEASEPKLLPQESILILDNNRKEDDEAPDLDDIICHSDSTKRHSRLKRKLMFSSSSSSDEDNSTSLFPGKPNCSKEISEESSGDDEHCPADCKELPERKDEAVLPAERKPNKGVLVCCTQKNEDKGRVYDKKQACFYCGKLVCKIARHYEQKHKSERNVAIALSFTKGSPSRKKHLEKLRLLGNYHHNLTVLETGNGELILKRRPSSVEKCIPDDFLPCSHCLGFFKRQELWKHIKGCGAKPKDEDTDAPKYQKVQAKAKLLLLNSTSASSSDNNYILSQLFSTMKRDEVSLIARNDWLIKEVGLFFIEKHGEKQQHLTSQKMRELARFLTELRAADFSPNAHLSDFIKPEKFDVVVSAVKSLTKFEFQEGVQRVATPSLSLKVGHSLKKCVSILRGQALRRQDKDLQEEADNFEKLLDSEWSRRVSHHSLSTLGTSKFNKVQILPIAEDLEKLRRSILSKISSSTQVLAEQPELQAWSQLAQATLARLVIFNKRRGGEASKLLSESYQHRPDWKQVNNPEITASLNDFERELSKRLDMVETRGKRGRKVAVILTPEVKASIDLLNKTRKAVGIPDENPFIFPRPTRQSLDHMRANDCLRKFAKECDPPLSNPENVTSTKLRKYIATITQVLSLKETEVDWLARHLGHDIQVHRDFYRLHESTIEIAKISKLLLTVDQGETRKFAGKSLAEINLNDIADPVLSDDDDDDDDTDADMDDEDSDRNDSKGIFSAIKVPGKKSTLPKKRENADRGMPKSKTLKVPAKNSAPKNKCKTRKKTAKENGDCAMPKSKSSYLSDLESDDCNDDSASTHALEVPGKKPNPPKKRVSRKIPDKENEDQGKQKTKMPWTEEEKGAVYKHLSSFVRQGRCPGKRDCENCILKSNGALERREWLAVKYFVKNQVDKRKRVLAPKNN